jgi:hypothetical protein
LVTELQLVWHCSNEKQHEVVYALVHMFHMHNQKYIDIRIELSKFKYLCQNQYKTYIKYDRTTRLCRSTGWWLVLVISIGNLYD